MVRSLRLAVRTSPSHGENRSSILLGSANLFNYLLVIFQFLLVSSSTFLQRTILSIGRKVFAALQNDQTKG